MQKKFQVIVNPASGKGEGKRMLNALKEKADSHRIQLNIRVTERPGEAEKIGKESRENRLSDVIVIGGDGTLHEVINGLTASTDPSSPLPRLGILPAGTGNSLATDLGITTPASALHHIFSERTFPIDLFRVCFDGQNRVGFTMLGCGLPARINRAAEDSRIFKGLRYEAGVVKSLIHYRPSEVEVYVPESDITVWTDFMISANTRNIGNGIHIAPEAELDDGLLDVVTVSRTGRRTLLSLWFRLMRGTHMNSPMVQHLTTASFRVKASEPQPLNLDGELFTFTEISCDMMPHPLSLLYDSEKEMA